MVDYDELNRRIDDSGYKRGALAQKLGLTAGGFRNKVFGAYPFDVQEADQLANLLGMTDQELLQIFFKRVHVDFDIYQKGERL